MHDNVEWPPLSKLNPGGSSIVLGSALGHADASRQAPSWSPKGFDRLSLWYQQHVLSTICNSVYYYISGTQIQPTTNSSLQYVFALHLLMTPNKGNLQNSWRLRSSKGSVIQWSPLKILEQNGWQYLFIREKITAADSLGIWSNNPSLGVTMFMDFLGLSYPKIQAHIWYILVGNFGKSVTHTDV